MSTMGEWIGSTEPTEMNEKVEMSTLLALHYPSHSFLGQKRSVMEEEFNWSCPVGQGCWLFACASFITAIATPQPQPQK